MTDKETVDWDSILPPLKPKTPKKRISTKSGKAKGRKLQQVTRDYLREIGKNFGLVDDDIQSTVMGISGVDITLSPAAKKVFGDLACEAKNREQMNVVSTFWQHWQKYKTSLCLLISKKNHTQPLVTLKLDDFMKIYGASIAATQNEN